MPCGVLAESGDAAPARTVAVVRLAADESVRVDGDLSEAVWQRAAVASDFLQREPFNGSPATERTEVRLLYDSTRLLIGVVLHDTEPDRILGNQMQRDRTFAADDRFMWTLDPFLDGVNGFYFEINPSGAMGDALITGGTAGGELGASINRSWDGIWLARVRRTATGWSAEVEIPFRTLSFDPSLDAWGVNFQRTVRRKNEENLWTGHSRNQGLARMDNAGRVVGFERLSQGVGLDVKPYAVGTMSAAPGRGRPDRATDGDIGVDAFYNITPALRATVSVNTDFAETEVDQRRVNLTRFPLFFEEKRDFFLAGANYFDFRSDPGRDVAPFFSRRIGLDESSLPQRIDVGAKLTGQTGLFDVGVLQVRTADVGSLAGEDFSVARVRRRMFGQSALGGIYTRRAVRRAGAEARHTAGADLVLRTANFRGGRNLELDAYYIWTNNPRDTGASTARGFFLRYPNDPFRINLAVRDVGQNYDPAVGFVERVGFWRPNPDAGYRWRPATAHRYLRDIDVNVDLSWYLSRPGNRLLTAENVFTPLHVTYHDGSNFLFEVRQLQEGLVEAFEISDGIVLPAGADYAFVRYAVQGATADRRTVSVSSRFETGGFFSGTRNEFTATLGVRPRRGVALSLEFERNLVDLAEGSFDTTVLRLLANTQFSPWLSVGNNLQYDSVSRGLGWQMRLRWIQRPGNDLFIVYTHNWRDLSIGPAARRFATFDNRLATKLLYTLRL